MYLTLEEATKLARQVREGLAQVRNEVDVAICPPLPWLVPVEAVLGRSKRLGLGAQDASPGVFGNQTGSVSLGLLKPHIDYVLVGHSERRLAQLETHKTINAKVLDALRRRITPILFVGEFVKLYDHRRQRGRPTKVEAESNIFMQLRRGLKGVRREQLSSVVIAYEPAWAIAPNPPSGPEASLDRGPADPEYVRVMVGTLRRAIARQSSKRIAANTRILYGGSVSDQTAAQYAAIQGIDGAVVGTASRQADEFLEIVSAFDARSA